MILGELTEGWTKRLTFTAKLDGSAVDLTNYDVELVLRASPLKGGTTIDTSEKVTKAPSQATTGKGKVYYDPAAADLQNAYSPMTVHLILTDSEEKDVSAPTGQADQIIVARR